MTTPLQTSQVADAVHPTSAEKLAELYDRDYLAWIEATLQALRQQDYSSVDWENLIEEIAGMSRSEKRRVASNLRVIIMHLLKWQYQPARRSKSWKASIIEHRIRVKDNLKESPSLKPFVETEFLAIYRNAVKIAAVETGLSTNSFPTDCPYAIAQVLDEDFLPE